MSSKYTKDSIAIAMVSKGTDSKEALARHAERLALEHALGSAITKRPWLTRSK